ncbi:type 2 lantipeptide synthetase LanM [Cyanobacteria bacterium FACHB-DQ100]|nr:type 2 lantipeptide synthetase LanM [Cyanobacteria bacterium FACHB-DQ100]
MNPPEFQASAWYQALTLTERIASLRAVQGKTPNVEVNADLAERRMQRWRSQVPFTTSSHFEQRLAIDDITEDEFRKLLGEPIESVRDRLSKPPAWLAELTQAFSRPAGSNTLSLPEELEDYEMAGFLSAIEPLISKGREQLHEGIKTLQSMRSNLPFDPSTVEVVLFASLPGRLLWMLSRTMVLELNIARLQGLLQGDTAEDRFQSFLQRLQERDIAITLLQEYPVLARQLKICIDNWAIFSLEFLHHVCADWEAIRTTFSLENDPGVLVQVHSGLGDRHRGGREVLIAEFTSGFQVLYKPKSLAVDVHFQELLTWINQRGDHPSFRTLKILDRGAYGWVEFVAAQGCTSADEIQRFYERQGGYLALLYAIGATDFHCENLIAAGEDSVLVDLESLFHPRPEAIRTTHISQLAINTMEYSVLGVGLLPERSWSNAEHEGIDLSGLGGKEGQLSPHRLPYWEGTGTDEMRLKRERMVIPGSQNRPTLNGIDVNVLDYTEAIVSGFTAIYRLLLKHRDELLSGNGPLARFAEDEVRIIVRATGGYLRLLDDSFHPDLLRSALDRDRFFDRLWVGIENSPYLVKVIPAEREDLQKGDVPMFTTRPSSHDIWSSSDERIANFFAQSGLELAQNRLQQLSDQDLQRQTWFIRASLTTVSVGVTQVQWQTYQLTEPETIADREQLLLAAQAIGDRLETITLRSEDCATWLGLVFQKERYWCLSPLALDLYDGVAGVALFLAYLGAITQELRYRKLARAALSTMQRQMERHKSSINWIGAFQGCGGVIYTLAHLGVLWNDPSLLAEAEAIVELLPPLIEKDKQIDIVSGAAGCIGSLISLYNCVPSERTLAAAIQCGDYLIARAQPMKQGIGWVVPDAGETPLTGFSHGTAGIAWALLELAALTHEKRFRTAALQAIDYERSVFSPEMENWPDLREFEIAANNGQIDCMAAWCHGAPGIGLARLRCLRHHDDREIRNEIDTALKTTLSKGFGSNHSLCHGDLGNLELLLQAGEILNEPQWSFKAKQLAAAILESIEQHGWLCGNPLGVESPGLMTGVSGIGYELLRLVDPARVPSVLVLEPPRLNYTGQGFNRLSVVSAPKTK